MKLKMPQIARVTLLASTAILAAIHANPVLAAAPMAKFSAPGFFRIMIGEFEVTALTDGTLKLPADQYLSAEPAHTLNMLAESFQSTPVDTSVNAYLINTGKKLILIDTGTGVNAGALTGKLISNLKSSGYEADQIDEIYITHFHNDHIGGLTQNGAQVFPNAIVRANASEANYWLGQKSVFGVPPEEQAAFKQAMATLSPYINSERFQAFNGDEELAPGISASSTIGHTAGHTSYVIQSQGQKLVILGDLIHVAAVQFDDPTVTISFDKDPNAARATRLKVFGEAAHDKTLVAAAHIQFPGMGHIAAIGSSFKWIPIDYTQMH